MEIESKYIETVGKASTGQWQMVLSRDLPDELIKELSTIGQKDNSIGNTEENRNKVAENRLTCKVPYLIYPNIL